MSSHLSFLAAILLVAVYDAAVIERGPCPKVTVVHNFDLNKYSGKWFELQKFPAPLIEPNLKCVKAEYTINGTIVMVNNTGTDMTTGAFSEADGTARGDDLTVAAYKVTFTSSIPSDPNYLVLSTDYTNYTLVYACTDYGTFNVQFAWILSRSCRMEDAQLTKLRAVFNDFGIHSEKLTVTNQDCWDANCNPK